MDDLGVPGYPYFRKHPFLPSTVVYHLYTPFGRTMMPPSSCIFQDWSFWRSTGAKGPRPIGYDLVGKERTVKVINDVKPPLSVFAKSVSWHKRNKTTRHRQGGWHIYCWDLQQKNTLVKIMRWDSTRIISPKTILILKYAICILKPRGVVESRFSEQSRKNGSVEDESLCFERTWLTRKTLCASFHVSHDFLGGGFKYFLFSPLFGEMIQFD